MTSIGTALGSFPAVLAAAGGILAVAAEGVGRAVPGRLAVAGAPHAAEAVAAPVDPSRAPGTFLLDAYTLVGERDFLRGYEATNADGTINAVVEIPAGTTAKWEVREDGGMHWDMKDGNPRRVQYLGYPVNYGMVPRTLLAEAMGGDGDPLDVLLLGDALPRGAVVPATIVGVLKLTDKGERDDKLIAVRAWTPFQSVENLRRLEEDFPGVTAILTTWFVNYKGPGVLTSQGVGDVAEAQALLAATIEAFARPPERAAPDAGKP